MFRAILTAFWLLLLVVSCSTVKVSTQYDRSADFSVIETYRWMRQTPSDRPGAEYELSEQQVFLRECVDSQMVDIGLHQSDTGLPDVHVAIFVLARDAVRAQASRMIEKRDMYESATAWKEGMVVVAILEGETLVELWQGRAVCGLNEGEDREQVFREAITKIMAKFPPGRDKYRRKG